MARNALNDASTREQTRALHSSDGSRAHGKMRHMRSVKEETKRDLEDCARACSLYPQQHGTAARPASGAHAARAKTALDEGGGPGAAAASAAPEALQEVYIPAACASAAPACLPGLPGEALVPALGRSQATWRYAQSAHRVQPSYGATPPACERPHWASAWVWVLLHLQVVGRHQDHCSDMHRPAPLPSQRNSRHGPQNSTQARQPLGYAEHRTTVARRRVWQRPLHALHSKWHRAPLYPLHPLGQPCAK